ncbi:MAG: formate dehydrogenase cytochrome b556 subunit, partial [Mesorhizobium sp.]
MTAHDVEPGKVRPGKPVTVDRYTVGARINHWITAASLIVLA